MNKSSGVWGIASWISTTYTPSFLVQLDFLCTTIHRISISIHIEKKSIQKGVLNWSRAFHWNQRHLKDEFDGLFCTADECVRLWPRFRWSRTISKTTDEHTMHHQKMFSSFWKETSENLQYFADVKFKSLKKSVTVSSSNETSKTFSVGLLLTFMEFDSKSMQILIEKHYSGSFSVLEADHVGARSLFERVKIRWRNQLHTFPHNLSWQGHHHHQLSPWHKNLENIFFFRPAQRGYIDNKMGEKDTKTYVKRDEKPNVSLKKHSSVKLIWKTIWQAVFKLALQMMHHNWASFPKAAPRRF